MDALIFSGLILLQVVLVAWVYMARPPTEVLRKYPTRSVLLSWLPKYSKSQEVQKAPLAEHKLLSRYKRRIVIQFWSIVLSVLFMCAYIYFSVGAQINY